MKLYNWLDTIDQKPYLTIIICGIHFKSKKWQKQALACRYLARQSRQAKDKASSKQKKQRDAFVFQIFWPFQKTWTLK